MRTARDSMLHTDLKTEQRLLILLSRITITDDCEQEIRGLMDESINWCELFQYALYNRVLTLVFKNVKKYCKPSAVPKYINNMILFSYLGTVKQNEIYLEELERIVGILRNNEITCLPVKGALLVPTLYCDYGLRAMGDLDCLVRKEDTEKLAKIMVEQGYCQGRYDGKTKSIQPIERIERLKWKMSMGNLFPFLKPVENQEYAKTIKFDFRFSLDDSLDPAAVNEIVALSNPQKGIRAEHAIVEMCAHLYDEAKQSMNIITGKDINLIKFCDIYEFALASGDVTGTLLEAVRFAKKYKLDKQMYFTFYYLKQLYGGEYCDLVLQQFSFEDELFLISFGENSSDCPYRFERPFLERMFSGNNASELKSMPKYFQI